MFAVECTYKFEAAHRLPNHNGKCKSLHGHSYKVRVCIFNEKGLDNQGMVIDFGEVKKTVGKWIDDNLDHKTILWKEDALVDVIDNHSSDHLFVTEEPPTAENIAKLIYDMTSMYIDDGEKGTRIDFVEVQETENNKALFMPERAVEMLSPAEPPFEEEYPEYEGDYGIEDDYDYNK